MSSIRIRRHEMTLLPESARVYFWNIPPWIGFQVADGPALRVWYGDPTLSGHFLSAYASDPRRPAFFFGHDDWPGCRSNNSR